MLFSLFTAFGLGFLYFISAIPTAVAAGAPLWAATFFAWSGYSVGSIVVIIMGAPLRHWISHKWNLSLKPDPKKLFWRIWERFGIAGFALIAPITLGPQVGALLLLTLGMSPGKIGVSLSLGVIPWALGFAFVVQGGLHFFAS